MADFLLGMEQLIPFFFVLAVVYGGLDVSKVLESKGVKGIISLVIALFAIISPGVAEFIYAVLPYAAAIFIVFFFIGFVLSFFREKEGSSKKDLTLPVIIGGLILIFIAGQGDTLRDMLPSLGFLGNENFLVLIIVVVILLILLAAYKKEEK